MSKAALDRSVLDIISDPECGTADDKLRLFLIYFICSPNMTEVTINPNPTRELSYLIYYNLYELFRLKQISMLQLLLKLAAISMPYVT